MVKESGVETPHSKTLFGVRRFITAFFRRAAQGKESGVETPHSKRGLPIGRRGTKYPRTHDESCEDFLMSAKNDDQAQLRLIQQILRLPAEQLGDVEDFFAVSGAGARARAPVQA